MNNTITNVLIFSLGAATGSLVAWRILKTKYERIAQNEIDSYKQYIRDKKSNEPDEDEEGEQPKNVSEPTEEHKPEIPQDILNRYRSDSEEDSEPVNEPYVISPEEYGTQEGYDCVSLTYYADGVLADDFDTIIENADSLVGDGFASHFGEYEPDSVFVRNDDTQCDYEILRDLNSFADTIGEC